MYRIPFQTIDWAEVEKTEHTGETGTSFWQTIELGGLRLRVVEYTKGYFADHWCRKGHVVYCLEGEFVNELENGESNVIKKGMSYVVSDDLSIHRSMTESGARLLITDGDFLKPNSPEITIKA